MTLKFIKTHVILTVLGFFGLLMFYAQSGASEYLLGAVLGGVNIALIIWICERMISKKGFALTLLAGVGKYLVLLTVFAWAIMSGWTPTGFFILGVLSLVPSVGRFAFQLKEALNAF